MSESNMTASVEAQRIKKQNANAPFTITDEVACEYALELRVGEHFRRAITCSCSDLEDFVYGHLYTEGFIQAASDVLSLDMQPGRALARLKNETAARGEAEILTTGSRGAPVQREDAPIVRSAQISDFAAVMEASETLLSANPYFNSTGALHSAAISVDGGALDYLRVDLGRHNAADKSIGAALRAGVDFSKTVLYTTGRVPTDMLWKAIRAGIPAMISRGAVTMQAIELARRYGVCLCGFSRGERLNLYSGKDSEA